MNKIIIVWSIVLFCVLTPITATASVLYSNDFEGTVGNEWSHTSIDTTPIGNRNFLGEFNPETVERTPWGSLELDLDCNGGTATYSSTEEGFGTGVLNVVRLTNVVGLGCP